MRIALIAAALVLASAGAAYAQLSGTEIVKAFDKNGDGVVTRDEWVAAGRPAERFDLVDANHDGKLTAEEIDQALARMRESRGGSAAPPAQAAQPQQGAPEARTEAAKPDAKPAAPPAGPTATAPNPPPAPPRK